MIQAKYVIIGNSAGGIGAAEAIREVDKTGSILIISDEPYPAYSRPMISEYLGEGITLDRMLYRPVDFCAKNGIERIFGVRASRLDPEKHTLELSDGREVAWEKLLLSTGGVPIVPDVPGRDKKGVFTFTTLDDAKAISQYLTGRDRAVVIGGGLIGVSASEALVKRGVQVTIVEMKDYILNVLLDQATASVAASALKGAGVGIITGHTVAKINGVGGVVVGVTLDDGRELLANLVVFAIGVRPRLDLVKNTGIKTGRGIIVDRRMATSAPDVYAAGDAAEAYDFIYNENRLTPIWPNAHVGGRVAGFNMAGVVKEYPGGTAMNSLKYFGVDIVSAGMVLAPDASYEVVCEGGGRLSRRLMLKDGVIVGMVFVGDTEKSGVVFGLMRDRVNAAGFKEALVAPDFSLVSLPEELRRERLAAALGR
jgi:NAD(P)H-nitrite reductase large subunit